MAYIIWIFYDILYGLVLFFSLPLFGKRFFGRDRKYHDFLERFAVYHGKTIPSQQQDKSIWIHAVSIGELLASFPLIEELSAKFKDSQFVLSCVSRSARTIAEEKLPPDIIKIFLPFDFSVVVDAAVRRWKPTIFISIEAEIWPNLFRTLKKYETQIVILNGRISKKSFRAYSFVRIFLKKTIDCVDFFMMRSQKDAENIINLGADRKKVSIAGSMKFDYAYKLSQYYHEQRERAIVFGSIHRGEEEPIAEITRDIIQKYDDVSVVVVPRALDRTNIYQIFKQKSIPFERYSQQSGKSRVLVVDRYGVLTDFYRKCEFAFVGGSLVPAGGQNPIEPLAFRKPVIYGNFHEDFEEEWEKILEAGAGFEVRSFDELSKNIEFLLNNPHISRSMGEIGYRVVLENSGGIRKIMKILEKHLNKSKNSITDSKEVP